MNDQPNPQEEPRPLSEPSSETQGAFSAEETPRSETSPQEPINHTSPPPSWFGPAAVPPRRERKPFGWAEFFGGTLFGCGCLPLLAFLAFTMAVGSMGMSSGKPSFRKNSVALIDVSGIITSGRSPGGPFSEGGAGAMDIVDDLEVARKNKRIKAVVLWVNSPGGSAAGSDVIYREIQRVRAEGKPVVVAMGDVAASGGYYIAAAADRVFANGATLTGSIGVITELSDLSALFRKVGYDSVVIKSGEFKDMGNPARKMTAQEKALFQQMVNDIYNQFLAAVSKGRNIPMDKLKPLADGRVYTGREAVKLGLVDEIGTLQDAVRYAADKANLGSDPFVHRIESNPFTDLFGTTESSAQQSLQRKLLGLMLLDPRARELARGFHSSGIPAPIPGER